MSRWSERLSFGAAVLVALAVASPVAWAGPERLHPKLRLLAELSQADAPSLPMDLTLPARELSAVVSVPVASLLDAILGGGNGIDVLVKLRSGMCGAQFAEIPVTVSTGSIVGLTVTLDELLLLAGNDEVVYVEPSWRTEPKLDVSMSAIGMAYVRSSFPDLDGSGVIVGFVDTGIDYLHPDFRYDSDGDGFEESSRILAIWDQTAGLFGTRYRRADIEADIALGLGPLDGSVRQGDTEGHGTRVAGIAASDGSSSGEGFSGVAPGVELVVVKTPFYTSDILAGVEYIFEQADARGMPAVVNLSLGGHAGPHDGTSLFEQGLDEMLDRPGRVIVVSAGNEGDEEIHVSRVLYAGSTTFSLVPAGGTIEVSLWYPGGARFDLSVALPGGGEITVPWGDSGAASVAGGDLYVDNAAAGPNPGNGQNEATLRLSGATGGERWELTVIDRVGGGRFHGWITSGEGRFVGGDTTHTIAEPGNARRVITVGSYNSRSTWPSLAGTQDFSSTYPIGPLTSFSSQGPTMDGRLKPEIAAPGAWVLSSRSGSAWVQNFLVHPDGFHEASLGTSFAAPHVSGVAALMLSIDASLSCTELRDILTDSAKRDAYTAIHPDDRWGYGKLDAAAALDAVEPPPNGDDGDPDHLSLEVVTQPAHELATFAYHVPEGTSRAILRVYSVSGGLVYEAGLDPALGRADWGLVTPRGEPVGTGLYLVVLVTDVGTSEVARLVVLR